MSLQTDCEVSKPHNAERPPYPIGVPLKFDESGVAQRYPGNTTVCHLASDSQLVAGLRKVYDTIKSHPTLGEKIRLLPAASWHMTVFDGVRETECEVGMWPVGMVKKPLPESTKDFSQRLRKFGMQLETEGLAPPYKMKVLDFDAAVVGIGLHVEGATPEEEKRMRRLRDRLASVLGFRAPNHEVYPFHISVAYLLRYIEGDDRIELNKVLDSLLPEIQMDFELGAVEFCTFENMLEYPRLFYLGEPETS
ncbi:uncharacterized protein MYCGRDRAFT_93449 [Zymoseptoria tritici IPO323]|uniref:DUF1868 domain-containing protein n=1 Tax=Zymoseptoria tritici (strain CBS 115943 / IPO323) TaxID=336722 RepID=F9XC24_ZYMTI|nr:uncharacterized protein MYCGRDRAFT_93449 [Zymoseptoria tritici IPO323]EGP87471.1 hypothetical protein MYCGRDRAFT_93449 [Zymoseptoria tritici IPO323]